MRFSVDWFQDLVWVSLTAKAWRTVCASATQQTARIVNEVRQNVNTRMFTLYSAVIRIAEVREIPDYPARRLRINPILRRTSKANDAARWPRL